MLNLLFRKCLLLALTCFTLSLPVAAQFPAHENTVYYEGRPYLLHVTTDAERKLWKSYGKDVNVLVMNDMGLNGYYVQKPIAELMGDFAGAVGIECVVAAGDIHHFYGVRSVNDPLWITNYDRVYSHPELMLPWYAVCGNHEYRGNTQAVVDYSTVSSRWRMPSRYYTKVIKENGTTLRLILVDTTPLIASYRADSAVYPDACHQDWQGQLEWVDRQLSTAKEDWVVVVGHHPIYADTSKGENERMDMQATLGRILRKHKNVDMYVCGHIHNFQHIRKPGDTIDYVINSSPSLSRKKVKAIDGTQFCSGEEGFSLISADKRQLVLRMIDKDGKVLHEVVRNK